MKRIFRFVLTTVFFLNLSIVNATFIPHEYPRICPRSGYFQVKANNHDMDVYKTPNSGSFVSFETDETILIEVFAIEKVEDVTILPLKLGIKPTISGNKISFKLPAGEKILVEIFGKEQLFIYSNPIAKNKPDPSDEKVHYYKSGQVHEPGMINLENDETLYIEGGAVVRGAIRSTSTKNITIGGYGVLDGGYFLDHELRRNVLIRDARNVSIHDIIMIDPPGWTLMLYYCQNVSIDGIKQLTDGHGSDGIDIVSSHDITINNCILRNGDDCIVIKSFTRPERHPDPVQNNIQGVKNVLVTNCRLQANWGGTAFEIGHELINDPVTNITYRDCDVLGLHGQGSVFGIHNCDGATVSNVLYENIRVDHYYNKLIDMRIIKSRWSKEEERGHAENITLRNIDVTVSRYNPGYSISLIGGYDEDHKIKNVTIENFRLNGKKVENLDELDLFLKQTENVIIK